MSFDLGQQASFKLEIKGIDADTKQPFCFKVDRLDYPTVMRALKHCALLSSRLNPELMGEIVTQLPEDSQKTVIENIEALKEKEHEFIISILADYFPEGHRHRLRYMIYEELVNLFYYLATGNEEIKSLSEIMQELEKVQEDYKHKKGLKKKKKKK